MTMTSRIDELREENERLRTRNTRLEDACQSFMESSALSLRDASAAERTLQDLQSRVASLLNAVSDLAKLYPSAATMLNAIVDAAQSWNRGTPIPSYLLTKTEQANLHGAFHRLWTKAVGTEGYDKSEWLELDKLIADLRFKTKESK